MALSWFFERFGRFLWHFILGLPVVWCFKDLFARDTGYGMGGIKSCEISGILLIYCYLRSTGLESFGSEHDVDLVRICLILVWCACDFPDFMPNCNPWCFCFWVAIWLFWVCVRDCVFVLDFTLVWVDNWLLLCLCMGGCLINQLLVLSCFPFSRC